VTVYEHFEKEGIVAEVIGAENADAIYNYLNNKNITVNKGTIPLVDKYIGKNYSFVVSWIEKSNTTLRSPSISINFPTDEIYYPLKLTSIYGEKKIPIVIYVAGWAKPKTYSGIKPFVKTEYFESIYSSDYIDSIREEYEKKYMHMDNDSQQRWMESHKYKYDILMGYDERFGNYTIIRIGNIGEKENLAASVYTEDLWIKRLENSPVPWIVFKQGIKKNSLFLIMIIIVSMISGYITGNIVFKNGRKFILISLANFMTWFGLGIALSFVKEEKKKKVKFWFLFPCIFMGVVLVLCIIYFFVVSLFYV